MKKLLLFAVFLGSTSMFSQETELQKLSASKILLEKEITTLEDSLKRITVKIDSLKSNSIQEMPVKKYSLALNELIATEKMQIRLEPDLNSKVVLELEKEIPVQKIDQIGDFFLVCYKGTCGYTPQALFENTKNKKKEDEKSSATNP